MTVDAAPEWFSRNIAVTPSSHRVEANGCDIHYLRWGPNAAEKSGLLFLHAGGAHARWWSFIAPFFADDRPVAAMDFSGMGDSGRRRRYRSEDHVAEIAAVLADADLGARPVIVGHSFGGFMAMCHGARYGQDLAGVVFVDTALKPPGANEAEPVKAYDRPTRYDPSRENLLKRFRLGPAQPARNPYILEFIAGHSVVARRQGWTWKFDVAARGAAHHAEPLAEYVAGLGCRKALIHGEESALVTPDVLPFLKSLFEPESPVIGIPGAHHHLFLDEPIAFVATLRAILAGWGL